ncbi:MAG: isoprenylcysteine carboxylmethyltransferase family protein [Candidatus Paceibacterota bacterium]|jgi:protein-S-isoprenylcysteine O-methyltransferase Ste14
MDKEHQNLNIEKKPVAGIVHVLLSHSYAVFFLAVVLGVIFDIMFAVHILNGIIYEYIGVVLITLGTLLIYWAQHTTGKTASTIKPLDRDINFFLHGPYRYTRNPTNFGLTLTILGFSLLIHSLFSVIFILITYFISKLIFIKKQDSILAERYGSAFADYKKKVKNWL